MLITCVERWTIVKKYLRQELIKELKNQNKQEKARYDRLLIDNLRVSSIYQKATKIALYMAFDFEFATDLLIEVAQKDQKSLFIPKTYPHGKMIFVAYDPDQLQKTAFGLMEPIANQAVEKSTLDLIVVPGLGFRPDGYRLGFGGGYYDRYLSDYKGETVSLIYPCQQVNFEVDSYDIPVRKVLLP